MMRKHHSFLLGSGLAMILSILDLDVAVARLGRSEANLLRERPAVSSHRRNVNRSNTSYTVHEYESGSTKIREYATLSGMIFAVAWNGMTHPDLDDLLGSYVSQYNTARLRTPVNAGQRHHREVNANNVVVQTWGHMRNLQGRAYDPALVPHGVDPNDLK